MADTLIYLEHNTRSDIMNAPEEAHFNIHQTFIRKVSI